MLLVSVVILKLPKRSFELEPLSKFILYVYCRCSSKDARNGIKDYQSLELMQDETHFYTAKRNAFLLQLTKV